MTVARREEVVGPALDREFHEVEVWLGVRPDAAAMPCTGSLYVATRRELILEHRDELLELAARLSEPEPVAVAVVADLARLVSDGCGPALPGGGPPSDLAAVTARSLRAIS